MPSAGLNIVSLALLAHHVNLLKFACHFPCSTCEESGSKLQHSCILWLWIVRSLRQHDSVWPLDKWFLFCCAGDKAPATLAQKWFCNTCYLSCHWNFLLCHWNLPFFAIIMHSQGGLNPLVPELFGCARNNLIVDHGIEYYRFIFLTRCWLRKPHSNHISLNKPRVWDSPHFLIEKIE